MGPPPEGHEENTRPLVIPVMGAVNVSFALAGGCLGFVTMVVGSSVFFSQLMVRSEPVSDGGELNRLGGAALIVAGFVLAKNLVLLLSGVGLLMSARWGRTLMLFYGGWGVVEVVGNLLFGRWVTLGHLDHEHLNTNSTIALLVGLSCVGLVFPALQLVVAHLPSVRRFFDGGPQGTMSACNDESS